MIIDFHTHIFPPEIIASRSRYVEQQEWFSRLYGNSDARMASAEGLIEAMDHCGVDRAVTCGFAWDDFGLYRETNDYIADAVSRFPDRLIGLANIPPLHPDAVDEIDRCVGLGLRGVGELKPAGQGFDLEDTDSLRPLTEVAAQHDLLLLIHLSEPVGKQYPGKGLTSPRKGFNFAASFPELRLVYAHWGGGLFFYELMPDVREALANVYYDCSANPYLYDREIFRVAMGLPVGEKILFASDYPLMRLDTCLKDAQAAGLDDQDREALMSGNALRLLGESG